MNSDTEITGYYFSATEPVDMAEGEVWFTSSAESDTPVNIFKENNVTIYPVCAKQMVSGILIDVIAKCYQNGEWSVLVIDLFLLGVDGYDSGLKTTYSNGGNVANSTVSVANNILTLSASFVNGVGGAQIAVSYDKAYDLTNYKTLEVNVTKVYGTSGTGACYINKNKSYVYGASHDAGLSLTTAGKRTLDISKLTGEYYIHFYIEAYPATVGYSVNEIVLRA